MFSLLTLCIDQFFCFDYLTNNFFEGQKGECRRADFVIIANTETKRIILCIEMKAKSTTSTELKIIQQLKGVKCLISYCREIGQSFWNQQDFLNDYEYRFVSIRNISIPKKPTRISHKTGIHNCPEQMLKVNSPHNLQFRSLI